MKLYHGTSEPLARLILKEGIKPRGKRRGNWKDQPSGADRVYLTTAYALYFALVTCKVTPNKADRWAIIEVESDLLDESKLGKSRKAIGSCARTA